MGRREVISDGGTGTRCQQWNKVASRQGKQLCLVFEADWCLSIRAVVDGERGNGMLVVLAALTTASLGNFTEVEYGGGNRNRVRTPERLSPSDRANPDFSRFVASTFSN